MGISIQVVISGVVGVLLSFISFIAVLLQWSRVHKVCWPLTLKRFIHSQLLIFSILECLYWAYYIRNPNDASPSAAIYSLHLFGGCALVFAFTFFMILWFEVLRIEQRVVRLATTLILIFLCCIFLFRGMANSHVYGRRHRESHRHRGL